MGWTYKTSGQIIVKGKTDKQGGLTFCNFSRLFVSIYPSTHTHTHKRKIRKQEKAKLTRHVLKRPELSVQPVINRAFISALQRTQVSKFSTLSTKGRGMIMKKKGLNHSTHCRSVVNSIFQSNSTLLLFFFHIISCQVARTHLHTNTTRTHKHTRARTHKHIHTRSHTHTNTHKHTHTHTLQYVRTK